MKLEDYLQEYHFEVLKQLGKLCGYKKITRKYDFIHMINLKMTTLPGIQEMWGKLDPIFQKAVAVAYHNEGVLNLKPFTAQYGKLPERDYKSKWSSWQQKPYLLDLFLYHPGNPNFFTQAFGQNWTSVIPSDMMPLLAEMVPSPERFQLEGVSEVPPTIELHMYKVGSKSKKISQWVDLNATLTEEAGFHDLLTYLRLISEGNISQTSANNINLRSTRKLLDELLTGDFLPLPENFRAADTIRPYGLDTFAKVAGLVDRKKDPILTEAGQALYQTHDPEILLTAFETWTEANGGDELERLTNLQGINTRSTKLTLAGLRRSKVIEALSWCPTDTWLRTSDFLRAIKIWDFDFEVEKTREYKLKVNGVIIYEDETYDLLIKGSYIKAILWEYLGSLGAVDICFSKPEESGLNYQLHNYNQMDYFSIYDGLQFFRINPLGAYLLGQASAYEPTQPLVRPILDVSDELLITITEPEKATPLIIGHLAQMAVPVNETTYRLDIQQLLNTLETGGSVEHLANFLANHQGAPLPPQVEAWFKKLYTNSQAIKIARPALYIKIKTTELAEQLAKDPFLAKYCHRVDNKTLVIPTSKQKAFQNRLKKLEYVLLE